MVEVFRSFKIRIKMKCISNSNLPTLLAISQIVYLPLLSIIYFTFERVALPVAVTGQPDFAASLNEI
jgi:hypothetical protein